MNAGKLESEGGFVPHDAAPPALGHEDDAQRGGRRAEAALAGENHVLEALRRSEAYLAEAQKLSHTGSFGWNASTGKLVWSAETFRIMGYERTATPTLEMVLNRVHPEDRNLVQEMIEAAARDGKNLDYEHRLLMPDGSVKHLHVLGHAGPEGPGKAEFVGAVMDVTERKRAAALVTGEKRLLEMIARGVALPSILGAICRFGEQMAGDVLVSILLVSADGRSLRHGAAPSLPAGYVAAIDGALIGPCAGSCGTAAFRGAPVDVSDIATDPLWLQYRQLALENGLRACWSTPVFSTSQEVVGTFALYSRKPCEPTLDQRNVIEQMTHLAAVAIERQRAEENLWQSEADLHEAQGLTHVGSWRHDLLSGKIRVSPEMHRIFQIQPHEDASDPRLYRGRIHPEDRQRVQELFDKCKREKLGCQAEFRIVLPDGTIRHQHSVGRPVLNQAGDAVEFVGTTMDVTEQKEAQEALRASEHLARGQVKALASTLAALAREPDPDRLLEHVLRTIVQQTRAHSIAAWHHSDDGARFDLIAVIEDGQYQTRKDADHPARRLSMPPEHHPVWREVLRTGQHGMMDNIDKESARMRIGAGDWHSVAEDIDPDQSFTILMKHLREMGVRVDLFVPLLIASNVAGLLAVRFEEQRTFRQEEIDLTRALAHQAMLAIQLMRLSQQSRQAAVMTERNRMARDIHDTLAQGFTGVIVQLEAVAEAMSQGLEAKAGECLNRAGALARESLQEARRSVRALRLQSLEGIDVCEAFQNLIRKLTTGTGIRAEFNVRGRPPELPPEWEENLLRIGQEVLTNVLRHAQASEFKARFAFEEEAIRLDLSDNGKGFDAAGRYDGLGLLGIKERAQAMGGRLRLRSAKNGGTAISVVLPLPHTADVNLP